MIAEDLYGKLLEAVSNVGADISAECEEFLLTVRASFSGSDQEFVDFVDQNVSNWFKCLTDYPNWIQNAEWQFHNGRPMVFVGELQIPISAGIYHDDARVYVFVAEDGVDRTVTQVA